MRAREKGPAVGTTGERELGALVPLPASFFRMTRDENVTPTVKSEDDPLTP